MIPIGPDIASMPREAIASWCALAASCPPPCSAYATVNPGDDDDDEDDDGHSKGGGNIDPDDDEGIGDDEDEDDEDEEPLWAGAYGGEAAVNRITGAAGDAACAVAPASC